VDLMTSLPDGNGDSPATLDHGLMDPHPPGTQVSDSIMTMAMTDIAAKGRGGLRDRGCQPRRMAAAGALPLAHRRPRAGAAHRRPAGLRPAGVAGPAAADGPVWRPAVPGRRPAAVG